MLRADGSANSLPSPTVTGRSMAGSTLLQKDGTAPTVEVLWLKPYQAGRCGDGHDEVRDADLYFERMDDEPADREMMPLVLQLIKKQTQAWSPKKASDPVQSKLLDIIVTEKRQIKEPAMAKSKGKSRAEPAPSNVINIMDALRKSLDAENRSRRH